MVTPTLADDAIIDTAAAAKLIGVSEKTLTKWRSTGENDIPYIKIGRAARYRTTHLNDWLERHIVRGGA